mgnify:CR=1 FL=1
MACILHLETSTDVCSVSLSEDGASLFTKEDFNGPSHAVTLGVFVDEVLSMADSAGKPLDAVAFSCGPGSYTGLRIGASMAKGICYGRNLPLIALPTLKVLSVPVLLNDELPEEALLCPMIDARRMEVYTAMYDANLQQVVPIEAKIIDGESWQAERAEHEIYFFGDGAMKCEAVLAGEHTHFVPDIVPKAAAMAALAERLDEQAIVKDKALAYFDPLYIKEFIPAPSHVKGL